MDAIVWRVNRLWAPVSYTVQAEFPNHPGQHFIPSRLLHRSVPGRSKKRRPLPERIQKEAFGIFVVCGASRAYLKIRARACEAFAIPGAKRFGDDVKILKKARD